MAYWDLLFLLDLPFQLLLSLSLFLACAFLLSFRLFGRARHRGMDLLGLHQ